MAKLYGFRCDRCGDEYPKNSVKNPRDTTGFHTIGFAFVNTAKQVDRYDLCDKCLKELMFWAGNPGTMVIVGGMDLAREEEPVEEEDEEEDENE